MSLICVYFSFKANLVSQSHNLSILQRLGRASYSIFWYLYNISFIMEPNIIYAVEGENMSILTIRYGIVFTLFLFCLLSSLYVVLDIYGIYYNKSSDGNNNNNYVKKIIQVVSLHFLLYVGVMLPSLQVIQHGYLTLGSDRYMYIPTAIIISPFISKIFHVVLFNTKIQGINNDKNNNRKSKIIMVKQRIISKQHIKKSKTPSPPVVATMITKSKLKPKVPSSTALWLVYTVMVVYVAMATNETASAVSTWANSTNLWTHAHSYYLKDVNISHSPVLSEIVLNLAETHRENEKYHLSLQLHREAVRLNNKSAHGYNNLANLLVEMKKEGVVIDDENEFEEDAIKYAKKAIELNPKMSESMANLAIIYNQGGNPWEAIEWYEKALTNAEQEVWQRKNLAVVSKSKGTRILKSPGFYLAYGNAIEATKKKGTMLTAYESYQVAYKLNPEYPLINEKMAKYQDDLNKKVAFLQKEIELFPDNSDAYYNLGNAMNKLKKFEQAIQFYVKSLEIKPKATDAMINIAAIYLNSLENCKESIRWAYKLLNEDSNHVRAKKILKRCGDIK